MWLLPLMHIIMSVHLAYTLMRNKWRIFYHGKTGMFAFHGCLSKSLKPLKSFARFCWIQWFDPFLTGAEAKWSEKWNDDESFSFLVLNVNFRVSRILVEIRETTWRKPLTNLACFCWIQWLEPIFERRYRIRKMRWWWKFQFSRGERECTARLLFLVLGCKC